MTRRLANQRDTAPSPPSVGIAVLAAGASRRLGIPKQLVRFRGQPLLRHVVASSAASACRRVGVVLGARADQIAPCLSDCDADLVFNPDWQSGLSSSVRAACRWAMANRFSGLLLALGDQPFFDMQHANELIGAFAATGRVVCSRYRGVRAAPAVFPRSLFPALLALDGDRGAGSVLRDLLDVVELPWSRGRFDIDEPADLAILEEGPRPIPSEPRPAGNLAPGQEAMGRRVIRGTRGALS